jgi:hypothetical protein
VLSGSLLQAARHSQRESYEEKFMPPPDDFPADLAATRSYTLHPLRALDGVLIYCTLNGETVAYCFGADEREAAESLARQLPELAATTGGERS